MLRVISSSPGELEPVFQAMLENATRICEAKFGTLFRFDGDAFHLATQVGAPPEFAEFQTRRGPFQPTPGSRSRSHVMRTKQVSPHRRPRRRRPSPSRGSRGSAGARSLVGVPMLKDDELIGAITIYRQEVRPFTDKQIELVQNFAAQAVIAIENTRLLNELRASRWSSRRPRRTCCASSVTSPGDLEPVFEAMLENAVRICEAKFGDLLSRDDGDAFRSRAMHNAPPAFAEFRRSSAVDLAPDAGRRSGASADKAGRSHRRCR